MELNVVEKSKNTLRVEVVNPDDTVVYPLISQLLKDERVEDARYITGHPFLDKPTIFLKVKKGKPKEVMKEVALGLADKYGEMKEKVQEIMEETE
ncbi:MAG: RpoL/Rpb11 RNA polymerase subunit family protein [Thermoplasmata archaeon]